jgi:glutamate synthase domain-containing protein 3
MSSVVDVEKTAEVLAAAGPVVNAAGNDLRAVSARVKDALGQAGLVHVEGAAEVYGLAAGLQFGEVIIEGDSGDYLGVLNRGATIRVQGDAGPYLADNMTRGSVYVQGDAGYAAASYCYGGTVVITGDAGDFCAVMNKGATVIVGGDVGSDAATYMLAGDLIIVGDAGANLGNYLIRGNIYVGGQWQSLGHNTQARELTEADLDKLQAHFEHYGIAADPAMFRKIVALSPKPFYKSKTQLPVAATPRYE